jgi:hypothetical protein
MCAEEPHTSKNRFIKERYRGTVLWVKKRYPASMTTRLEMAIMEVIQPVQERRLHISRRSIPYPSLVPKPYSHLKDRRKNMKTRKFVFVTLSVIVLLAMSVSFATAQGPLADPSKDDDVIVGDVSSSLMTGSFPIQGRLTNAAGNPVPDGDYSITASLYTALSGGTALCFDNDPTIAVTNGLFNMVVDGCSAYITGGTLYVGIKVGSDLEMTPRQEIYPVPYAMVAGTLEVGADIIGSTSYAVLDIENSSSSGRGLRSYATSATGTNYGVVGASESPDGYGGYFYNTNGGTALYGESNTGPAIVAAGTGVIKSSAQTSIWISGNDVRPYRSTDTTVIDLESIGGAKVYPGTTVGPKNVMLPITVPGPLYGQNVKVVGMDIYWQGSTEFDGISSVLMRRQNGGVCASCYVNIVNDTADKVCDVANNATGCITHYDLTTNNTLTSTSGILYLTLGLNFGGTSGWVDLGGIRLVLEHD